MCNPCVVDRRPPETGPGVNPIVPLSYFPLLHIFIAKESSQNKPEPGSGLRKRQDGTQCRRGFCRAFNAPCQAPATAQGQEPQKQPLSTSRAMPGIGHHIHVAESVKAAIVGEHGVTKAPTDNRSLGHTDDISDRKVFRSKQQAEDPRVQGPPPTQCQQPCVTSYQQPGASHRKKKRKAVAPRVSSGKGRGQMELRASRHRHTWELERDTSGRHLGCTEHSKGRVALTGGGYDTLTSSPSSPSSTPAEPAGSQHLCGPAGTEADCFQTNPLAVRIS